MPRHYGLIDNHFYNAETDLWWQPTSALYLLRTTVNPVRVGYARRKLLEDLRISPIGKQALEVGCGGGLLCEEIAAIGFTTTGIDPSLRALHHADQHARLNGLTISYHQGCGETLPYQDSSFDVVFCCDVLEHVHSPSRVIAEISRVLKTGGVFCYDTINRTMVSWLVAIGIAQRWSRWAFMPDNLHNWEMFITPDELLSHLKPHRLAWQGHRGVSPDGSLFKILRALRERARGECGYRELGEQLRLKESEDVSVMYMGYAVKE